MQIVEKIGNIKKEANISALDNTRWQEVLNSRMKQAKDLDLDETLVEDLFNRIHSESLTIENEK